MNIELDEVVVLDVSPVTHIHLGVGIQPWSLL